MLFHGAPFFIIGARMLIGGACLLAYTYRNHPIHCVPRRSDWPLYAQTVIFGIYLFYTLRAWSLQYITTTKAALLMNLLPFFTAIFSYFHFQERLTTPHVLGLICGFLGMVPLFISSTPYEDLLGGISFFSWPELAMIGAVAALGYNVIIVQKLVKHRECPPTLVNGVSMMIGGIMAFISSFLVEPTWIRGNWKTLFMLILVQTVVSNLICSNLHGYLLRYYSATFMSFASFLSPLSTILYGYLFLGEIVTGYFFISFLLVVAGLAIYHWTDIRKSLL